MKATCKRLQVFINRCLRTILRLQCSDKTTNEDMWERTRQRLAEQELGYRRWRWLGDTLRRLRESITRQALSWNPQGKRKKTDPEIHGDAKWNRRSRGQGRLGKNLEKTALDRRTWKDVVVDLCLQVAKR